MTSEEKAIELVENFAETLPKRIYGNLLIQDWISAKKCAKIAVDEILTVLNLLHKSEYCSFYDSDGSIGKDGYETIAYFEIVKLNIENL